MYAFYRRGNAAPVSHRATQPEKETPRKPDPKPQQPPTKVTNAAATVGNNGITGLCEAMTTGDIDDRTEAIFRLGMKEADVITRHADQVRDV